MTRHYCDKCGIDCGEHRWPITFERAVRDRRPDESFNCFVDMTRAPRADLCRDCYSQLAAVCRVAIAPVVA